jgi:hypothetical protein
MVFGTVIKMNTCRERAGREIVRFIGTKNGMDVAANFRIVNGNEELQDVFTVIDNKDKGSDKHETHL